MSNDFEIKHEDKFACCDGIKNSKGEVATTFVHLIQPIEDEDGEHNIDVEDEHENGRNPTHPACPQIVVTGIQKTGNAKRCGYFSHSSSDDEDGENRLKVYKKRTTYVRTGTEEGGQYVDGPGILVQEVSFNDASEMDSCVRECTPEDCLYTGGSCEGWYNVDDGLYYSTRVRTSTGVTSSDSNWSLTHNSPLVIHQVKSVNSSTGICDTSYDYEDPGEVGYTYNLDTGCNTEATDPLGNATSKVQNEESGSLTGTVQGPSEFSIFTGPFSFEEEDLVSYTRNEYYIDDDNPLAASCGGTPTESYTVSVDLRATFTGMDNYTFEEPIEVVTGPETSDDLIASPPSGESYTSGGFVPSGTNFYEDGVTIEQAISDLKATSDWVNSKSNNSGNVQVGYNNDNLKAGFDDTRSQNRSYKEARYAILVKNLVKDFQYKVFIPTYSKTNTFGSEETQYEILNGVTETFTATNLFHIIGGSLNSGITDEEFIDRQYSLSGSDYPNINLVHSDNEHSKQVIIPDQSSIVGPASGNFNAGTIYYIGDDITISETEGSYKYVSREPSYVSEHFDMPE